MYIHCLKVINIFIIKKGTIPILQPYGTFSNKMHSIKSSHEIAFWQ